MKELVIILLSFTLNIGYAVAAERNPPILIGALTEGFGPTSGTVGLRDGLEELGYRENRDFFIGVRFTQGETGALLKAAQDLVRQGVKILFTEGRSAAIAAKTATATVPIVFGGGGDPVGLGLINSFARPGGNITGVSDLDFELGPKRLEIFKEMIPGLERVLFLHHTDDTYSSVEAKSYRAAAPHLGIALVEKGVRSRQEAKTRLSQLDKENIEGVLSPRSMSLNIPGYIREAASRNSKPTMFSSTFFAENGGLASYTPQTYESGRMAARLVDKILRGQKPGIIPVETNHKIELVINLKVANALKITIAPQVLYRAQRVIR
ncbi:MAG: ABC transporter substrate-binding protein [Deltaproteobacteria bacterium]|nr:ABC transporter substrate-binding protein [Deltaproteobacteria bacterium]